MRVHWSVILICSLTLLHTQRVLPQWIQGTSDSLVDVFPLSVGNQWTYRYSTVAVSWPSGNPGTIRTDSGRAMIFVSGRTTYADSTSWQIQAARDLLRHEVFSSLGGPDRDTIYSVRDTSHFELIESHHAQHQVYRNADPYLTRDDVFPFTKGFDDTIMIYRYTHVGEGDTTALQSWIRPPPGPQFQSVFTFRKGIGLIRYIYNSGSVDVTAAVDHLLLSSTITSVNEGIGHLKPGSFFLYQNYPNPFNPNSNIRYLISEFRHVRLSMYDILGREVVELVNEWKSPGNYEVRFDGSCLSSGVYFYRLSVAQERDGQGGGFVQTRKLLLLR